MSRPLTEGGSGRNCANDVRLRDKSESSPPPWQKILKSQCPDCPGVSIIHYRACLSESVPQPPSRSSCHRIEPPSAIAPPRAPRRLHPAAVSAGFDAAMGSPPMPPLRRGSRPCWHALTHTKHAHVPSPTYMRALLRTPRGRRTPGKTLDTATAPIARARHTAAHLGRPSRDEEGLVPALLGSRSGAPAGTHAGAVGTLRVMRVPPLTTGGIPGKIPPGPWRSGGSAKKTRAGGFEVFPSNLRARTGRHEHGGRRGSNAAAVEARRL